MKTKLQNEKTRYLLGLSGQNILYALTILFFLFSILPAVSSLLAVLPFIKSKNR